MTLYSPHFPISPVSNFTLEGTVQVTLAEQDQLVSSSPSPLHVPRNTAAHMMQQRVPQSRR